MDLRKQKPSKRFDDHTDDRPWQQNLRLLGMLLNPVLAMRKFRSNQIDTGQYIPEDREKLAPRGDFQNLLNKAFLSEIMKRQDLVDPHTVQSAAYGDLIPKDRWDKMMKGR